MKNVRDELKKREDEEILKPQEERDDKKKAVNESEEESDSKQRAQGVVEELQEENFIPLADPEPNEESLGIEVNL